MTELETIRYKLKNSTLGSAETQYPAKFDASFFYIGLEKNGTKTDLGSRDGKAVLVNEKVNDDDRSDTDSVINSFRMGEDGKIKVSTNYVR